MVGSFLFFRKIRGLCESVVSLSTSLLSLIFPMTSRFYTFLPQISSLWTSDVFVMLVTWRSSRLAVRMASQQCSAYSICHRYQHKHNYRHCKESRHQNIHYSTLPTSAALPPPASARVALVVLEDDPAAWDMAGFEVSTYVEAITGHTRHFVLFGDASSIQLELGRFNA